MRNVFLSLVLSTLMLGCYKPIDNSANGGDSNGDKVKDVDQSVGVGVDDHGQPYIVFFNWFDLPPYRNDLEWIGYGCSALDGNPDDDWLAPCSPLVPYMVDGETIGYALMNIPEGQPFEGVPVDAMRFSPDGGGWANAETSQMPGDDPTFFVRHVDWSSCPLEDQSEAVHIGFIRIGDEIQGLGSSIAPSNEDCP